MEPKELIETLEPLKWWGGSYETCFSTLIREFPNSEELLAWLRSPAGGSLIVRESEDPDLVLIHYDKNRKPTIKTPHSALFRSVIWNRRTNRPVSVAPPRSRGLDALPADAAPGQLIVEDFVDGVMVNQFHDGTRWRLATRTRLDAGGHFFGSRSFAELFRETAAMVGLKEEDLDPACSYTWVLTHPEERIVVRPHYGIPRLTLVQTVHVSPEGFIGFCTRDTLQLLSFAPTLYPDLQTKEDVRAAVEVRGSVAGAGWQGLVVKLWDGRRFKCRSKEYMVARQLRGNQATLAFTWLERWAEGRLTEYLSVFPEERVSATATVTRFKALTQEVADQYRRVYQAHACRLGEAPAHFRRILWEIRESGINGNYFPNVRQFMNDMDTARKLWLLRMSATAAP